MLASRVLDLRRVLRFTSYTHCVPLSPVDQMEFDLDPDPDNGDELGILWLRPKENYPFYLRQSVYTFKQARSVPKKVVEESFDGGPIGHVVAVAILRESVRGEYAGLFDRHVWFVKSYDAFHGYKIHENQDGLVTWYGTDGPAEAVRPQDVIPNVSFKRNAWNDGDRSLLRGWKDSGEPKEWSLDFSLVPPWIAKEVPRIYPHWKKFDRTLYQMYVRRGRIARQWYYIMEDAPGDWRAVRNGAGCSYEMLGRYSTSKEAKAVCETDYQGTYSHSVITSA
jgi:hypothetical protein